MAKPKITRIKAGESGASLRDADESQTPITRKKVVIKDKKQEKIKAKAAKKAAKADAKIAKAEGASHNGDIDGSKKVFILLRPFVAFFRYLRDAWKEIRQVRWPNRKATWKMVLAVVIYTALFVVLISLLDLFFTWLFNLILNK